MNLKDMSAIVRPGQLNPHRAGGGLRPPPPKVLAEKVGRGGARALKFGITVLPFFPHIV